MRVESKTFADDTGRRRVWHFIPGYDEHDIEIAIACRAAKEGVIYYRDNEFWMITDIEPPAERFYGTLDVHAVSVGGDRKRHLKRWFEFMGWPTE